MSCGRVGFVCFLGAFLLCFGFFWGFFCHFSRSWRLFIPSTPSPSSLPLWQNPCSLSDVRLIRWVWSSLSVDLKTICLFSPSPFLLLLLHLLLGWELTVTKTHSSSRRMAQGVPRFFHDIRLEYKIAVWMSSTGQALIFLAAHRRP